VLAEALTGNAAYSASHCSRLFCIALHGSIIQLALVVCQQ
jgi:hypothetical protein